MPIYRTAGSLTGTIKAENVEEAQEYLTDDAMAKYLDEPLKSVVERLEWRLSTNGHDYVIEAVTTRKLKAKELKQLADEVSGQNSDGLGEGFEQQDFAQSNDECDGCDQCEAYPFDVCENGWAMISFDWKTNDSVFALVS